MGVSVMWRHLDGGGPPVDEVGQLPLADALQALVHLRRVHLTLHITSSNYCSYGITLELPNSFFLPRCSSSSPRSRQAHASQGQGPVQDAPRDAIFLNSSSVNSTVKAHSSMSSVDEKLEKSASVV